MSHTCSDIQLSSDDVADSSISVNGLNVEGSTVLTLGVVSARVSQRVLLIIRA